MAVEKTYRLELTLTPAQFEELEEYVTDMRGQIHALAGSAGGRWLFRATLVDRLWLAIKSAGRIGGIRR